VLGCQDFSNFAVLSGNIFQGIESCGLNVATETISIKFEVNQFTEFGYQTRLVNER